MMVTIEQQAKHHAEERASLVGSALSSLRGRISPCTPVVTPGHAHVADMVMVGGVATAESLLVAKVEPSTRLFGGTEGNAARSHEHCAHLASGSTTKLTECPSAK